ncbi:hypothetical protein ACU686_30025 [Yinghuangia aomiensis]
MVVLDGYRSGLDDLLSSSTTRASRPRKARGLEIRPVEERSANCWAVSRR